MVEETKSNVLYRLLIQARRLSKFSLCCHFGRKSASEPSSNTLSLRVPVPRHLSDILAQLEVTVP